MYLFPMTVYVQKSLFLRYETIILVANVLYCSHLIHLNFTHWKVLTILEYPSMDKYSGNSNYSIIVNIARFWLGLGTQDIFYSVSRKLFNDSK